MSPRTVRILLPLLLIVATGCKSKPAGEHPDYGLAAEQATLAARQKFYDLLLDIRPTNIYDLINAENELERDARKQLKPLVKEAEDLADKAIKVDAKDVRGHLAKSDALYLNAVCNGSTTSFFCGLKRKVRKYYRKAKQIDDTYGQGSAYRLEARYLLHVRWPIRDPELSERAAWRAADLAPESGPNMLTLGDIQWMRGKRIEAIRTWKSAAQTRPGDSGIDFDARELALRRLHVAGE